MGEEMKWIGPRKINELVWYMIGMIQKGFIDEMYLLVFLWT